MGWLQRLFGVEKTQQSTQDRAQAPQSTTSVAQAPNATPQSIPPERVGLNGEYDDSGLAKRVALAFDQDSTLDDVETLYVAQTGSTVVLKGKAPSQPILSKMVAVAKGVKGANAVDTSQVTVG